MLSKIFQPQNDGRTSSHRIPHSKIYLPTTHAVHGDGVRIRHRKCGLRSEVMSESQSRLRHVGMNESDCFQLIDKLDWKNFKSISCLTFLLTIDVIVICGNSMVIMAVYYTSKLRSSVTNVFIVSLAVADLMVGIAVLPFSAMWEVLKVWIFGDILCSIWLALDVWMCTASILNLCAISLDRYVAVTRPVTYPHLMSQKRAKYLLVVVWVLSFVICLPPLIGWKDNGTHSSFVIASTTEVSYLNVTTEMPSANVSSHNTRPNNEPSPPCSYICEMTKDTGYVIYSAFGSFFIPMFVMLFFYWKIYRAAVQTTRAINQGFRTTKTMRNRFDESRLTLRIHRGRGSSVRHNPNSSTCTLAATSAYNSVENSPSLRSPDTRLRCASTRKVERGHDKVKISVSYPSSDCLNTLIDSNGVANDGCVNRSGSLSISSSPSNSGKIYVHYTGSETNSFFHSKDPTSHLRVGGGRLSDTHPRRCSAGDTIAKPRHLSEQLSSPLPKDLSPSPSFEDGVTQKPKLIAKMGKRNIKAQVKRFRMETKAAKTLGIIVGGFIFCWLPFFTLYLIRAFCDSCIPPLVFSVMFWLGYCNSAINPLIYALFSKDFRFAFQRIIYCCFSDKFSLRDSKGARRGSDGSQLGAYRRTDRSPSFNEFPMSKVTSCSVNSGTEVVPPDSR